MPAEQQRDRAQVAELVQEYSASPPLKGLMEGLDPALMDSLYPPLFAPDLENFRLLGGKWETRLGQTLWKTLSGSGDGRLLDNLYQTAGTAPSAAQLTIASSQYLEDSVQTGSLYTGQDMTVGGWVYLDASGGGEKTICSIFDVTTASDFSFTLAYSGTDFFFKVAWLDYSGTLATITAGITPAAQTWYYVAGRHDSVAQTIAISINGAAPASVAYTHGLAEPVRPYRVGSLYLGPTTGQSFWGGRIQDLGFWRSTAGGGGALTNAQITTMYHSGVPLAYADLTAGQKTGLVSYWNLGEQAGTWVDSKGSFNLSPKPLADPPTSAAGLGSGASQTTRLAARGSGGIAQFYEYKDESDTSFQTVGSASLGGSTQPYFQGVTLGDRYVFTDRAGALRKYTRSAAAAGAIAAITNGTAPLAAAVVTSRWYDRLETWTTPGNWSASGSITLTDTTATAPPPGGGKSVNALITNTGGTGATLTANSTALPAGTSVPSHTIAFWLYQRIDTKTFTQLGLGINAADEFNLPLRCQVVNSWEPFFFPIGDIGTISFARLRVLDATRAPNGQIFSALYLPGRLEGAYRWIYTYYTSATGQETAPSPITNSGIATDFSAIGVTNDLNSGRAFQKSAALRFTANPGTADKIRIYRSGGVPELTKDTRGFDVWYRVGEIRDFTTTLNGGISAGVAAMTLTAATNIAVGDTLVIEPGVSAKEEYVKVTSIASAPALSVKGMDADGKTLYAHSNAVTVQVAFVDNVANETIDVTQPIEIQRNDPPSAALFVQRSPEGRLWIFGFDGNPTGVAVSNRATPDRTADYFTFPDGVDPLTRRSLTQGWRFKIGGDSTDEAIVWGGFFQGLAHVLTKRHMYVIEAQSQTDWGPIAVQKLFEVGCIAGDTVVEVGNSLMWVADGPRVMRWRGRGTAPEPVSHLRINERLNAASSTYWNKWFAKRHTIQKGNYYCLYFVPSGDTTCTMRLDYMADRDQVGGAEVGDAWEPVVYYDSDGTALSFFAANVRDGGSDNRDLYQMDADGQIWQAETGLTDGGVAIKVRAQTKKYPLAIFSRYPSGALGDVSPGSSRHILLGQVTMLMQMFVRNTGVSADTLSVTVTTGGSEYGETSHTYSIDLAGTGDVETKVRLHRDLYGRWAQIRFDGDFNNRPSIRECTFWGLPLRSGAIHT